MENIVSRELSIHQEHEVLLKLEQAGMNSKIAQKIIESKGNLLAKKMLEVAEPTKLVTVEITEPTSLLDLREKYGTGPKGFKNNDWWLDRDFAKEKIQPGTYVVNFEKQLTNKTFQEQQDALPEGWEIPHPTILAAAYFQHLEETGQRLLDDFWSRTSEKASDDDHVCLFSDSDGLHVYGIWDDYRNSDVGVAPVRKS